MLWIWSLNVWNKVKWLVPQSFQKQNKNLATISVNKKLAPAAQSGVMTQQITTEEESMGLIKRQKKVPENSIEKCGTTELYEKFSTPTHSVSKWKRGTSIKKILLYAISFWVQERTVGEQTSPPRPSLRRPVKGKSCSALSNRTGAISQVFAQADCHWETIQWACLEA